MARTRPNSADVPEPHRVAVVTGGGAGVGRATCLAFATAGTAVTVADIDASRADETADLVRASGGQAIAVPTDVSDEEAVRSMVDETVSTFGRLDVLHNNAAALGPHNYGRDTRVDELPLDVWETTMGVNLRGVMLGCKHAVPEMRRVGGGSIVNTVSVAALHGGDDHAAYGVSKAGVVFPDQVRRQHVRAGFDPLQRGRPGPGHERHRAGRPVRTSARRVRRRARAPVASRPRGHRQHRRVARQ